MTKCYFKYCLMESWRDIFTTLRASVVIKVVIKVHALSVHSPSITVPTRIMNIPHEEKFTHHISLLIIFLTILLQNNIKIIKIKQVKSTMLKGLLSLILTVY